MEGSWRQANDRSPLMHQTIYYCNLSLDNADAQCIIPNILHQQSQSKARLTPESEASLKEGAARVMIAIYTVLTIIKMYLVFGHKQ